MAKYRRQLTDHQQKYLLEDYKFHRDVEGGIFTKDKRRKLMGVKPEKNKQYHQDNPDFWYDVREYVKHGITDLRLLTEVADSNQINEIFMNKNTEAFPKKDKRYARDDLVALLDNLLFNRYVKEEKDSIDNNWKYELANALVNVGLSFFIRKKNLYTELHQRVFQDVRDVINLTYPPTR